MNYSEITATASMEAAAEVRAAAAATAAELVKVFGDYIAAHPGIPFDDLTAAVEAEVRKQLRL